MTAIRFFVYGTMLEGEPHHADLAGATPLGACRTAKGYAVIELAALAGLVEEGTSSATGELYAIDADLLMRLMKQPRHPGFYQLRPVTLEDGTRAECFFLDAAQVRGKRRVRNGDWKKRFQSHPPGTLHEAGALVSWARKRHRPL